MQAHPSMEYASDLNFDIYNAKAIQDPIERAAITNSLSFTDATPTAPKVDALETAFNDTIKAPDFKSDTNPYAESSSASKLPGMDEGSSADGILGGAKTAAAGGAADDIAADGLIASGNPYAMGAGMILKTFNANQEQKYKQNLANLAADQKQRDNIYASSRANQSAYDRMKNIAGQ